MMNVHEAMEAAITATVRPTSSGGLTDDERFELEDLRAMRRRLESLKAAAQASGAAPTYLHAARYGLGEVAKL